MSVHKTQLLRALQERVLCMERGRRPAEEAVVSSGCAGLDQLLPARGFRPGTLVEWLSAGGISGGAGTLAMTVARQAATEGKAIVVLDRARWFYPPAAAALGIDLKNLLVVRPGSRVDQLWALDQALRCRAVAAVWAPLEKLDQREFRRLQLAAEAGGGLGLLLRPAAVQGHPSWSDMQLLVEPRITQGGRVWRWRVQLVRCRGWTSGRMVELQMDEVTGAVTEVSRSS